MHTDRSPDRHARIMALLDEFVIARDWDRFHSPKNLVMALTGEVGELIEHFQWLTEAESQDVSAETRAAVQDEMADVQIYLMMLARRLNVDLLDAVEAKMAKNAHRYPVEAARGGGPKRTGR